MFSDRNKLIYVYFFTIFPNLKVLINIHEYSNQKICISDHVIKDLWYCFNLVPRLVVTEKQLVCGCFCRFTPILENNIMGCHGNHAFKHSQNIFFLGTLFWGHAWCPHEQFDTNGNLSWGSKAGQTRAKGTSNMIANACFSDFSSFFVFPPPPPQPKKIPFPNGFLGLFFLKTGQLPDTETVDNISQGIRYG